MTLSEDFYIFGNISTNSNDKLVKRWCARLWLTTRWLKWVSMTRGIPGNLFSQLSFLSLEKMILQAQAFTFFCLQLTPSDYNSSFNCSDLMHSAMLSLFRSSYSDIRPVVKVLQEHYSGWQESAHGWSDIIVGINLQLHAILSLNLVSTWEFWSADKLWWDFQFDYLTLILMKWGKWHIQEMFSFLN